MMALADASTLPSVTSASSQASSPAGTLHPPPFRHVASSGRSSLRRSGLLYALGCNQSPTGAPGQSAHIASHSIGTSPTQFTSEGTLRTPIAIGHRGDGAQATEDGFIDVPIGPFARLESWASMASMAETASSLPLKNWMASLNNLGSSLSNSVLNSPSRRPVRSSAELPGGIYQARESCLEMGRKVGPEPPQPAVPGGMGNAYWMSTCCRAATWPPSSFAAVVGRWDARVTAQRVEAPPARSHTLPSSATSCWMVRSLGLEPSPPGSCWGRLRPGCATAHV